MRATLRPEERVLYNTMKHWFCLIIPFIMVLGVFIFFLVAPHSLKTITGAGAVFSFAYLIYAYFERKYNIWVVTNMRVIDEFGVLSHNIKESPLEKINNTSFRQSLTGRLFGFGDIMIQTAAESGATVFSFVDKPKELNEAISLARFKYMQGGSVEATGERVAASGNTKACPMCAENVKAEALKCRFCGHVFAVAEVIKADPKPEQVATEITAPIATEPDAKLKTGFNPRDSWSKR